MNSLFIPAQFTETFLSTSKLAKEWCEPRYLHGILSPTDVGVYLASNIRANEYLGDDITLSFPNLVKASAPLDLEVLDREERTEFHSAMRAAKIITNGMVPTVLHFDGACLFLTLAEPVENQSPVENIVTEAGGVLSFEQLASLEIFKTYLRERQLQFKPAAL